MKSLRQSKTQSEIVSRVNSITVASREQSLIVPFHFRFIQPFLCLSSFLAIDSSLFFFALHFPSRLVLSFIFFFPFQWSLPYLFVLFSPLAFLPAVLHSSFIPAMKNCFALLPCYLLSCPCPKFTHPSSASFVSLSTYSFVLSCFLTAHNLIPLCALHVNHFILPPK